MPKISLDKLKRLQREARAILQEPEAEPPPEQLSAVRRAAHFIALVWASFKRNRCFVRASALAYTTLIALVPLLAVAVSVSTSFATMDRAKMTNEISKLILYMAPALGQNPNSEEAAVSSLQASQQILGAIQRVNVKTIGWSSTLALVFVAISLLSTVEDAFNDIWGVSRGRSWFSRVVLYWAALTLGPLLLAAAMTLSGASQFEGARLFIERVPAVGNLVFIFLPYVLLSAACAFFYMIMPNAKVNWRAALAGGIVAGCLVQLNNKLGILYVSRVATYYKLYGGIGAIPLFLAGLYLSWVILLLGGQVAYAVQNRKVYVQEKKAEHINQRGREFAALRLMTAVAQRFDRGERPLCSRELSEALGVPLRLAGKIIDQLADASLIIQTGGDEPGIAPARPLAQISAHDVLQALRVGRGEELDTAADPARAPLRGEYRAIEQAEETVAASVSLQTLVERTRPLRLANASRADAQLRPENLA